MSFVALRHAGSSRARERAHVPTGRQILKHWTTRKVPECCLLRTKLRLAITHFKFTEEKNCWYIIKTDSISNATL